LTGSETCTFDQVVVFRCETKETTLNTEKKQIRVLIVDDHPVVRFGLVHMLGATDDIEVVGELENAADLVTTLETTNPDVVLLDLELGDSHGADELQQLHESFPSVRVVIYTSHDEEQRIIQAAELGVDGYLLKGCPPDELIRAIRSVCDGGTALEASVAAKLMQHMTQRSARDASTSLTFSKRETQVLGLLAQGKTNREIGATLFISESTVKFHVHAILRKLGVGNRTEAVSIAVQQGIIQISSAE